MTTAERSIWWHWQNLNKESKKPWWQHSRAWLHWGQQTIGLEWSLFTPRCRFTIEFADRAQRERNLLIGIGLPFLFDLFLSVDYLPLVERLPGVRYEGNIENSQREIGVRFFDGGVWLSLWHEDHGWGPRRMWVWRPMDWLLGPKIYTKEVVETGLLTLHMPEGYYDATYTLYNAYWKRPRWPWPKHVLRGEIEVEDGVPVPGKGTTAYNIGEDAIYSLTTKARSVSELVGEFVKSVTETRIKYGGTNWQPEREPTP